MALIDWAPDGYLRICHPICQNLISLNFDFLVAHGQSGFFATLPINSGSPFANSLGDEFHPPVRIRTFSL
jgi:hypothetical protein